MIDSAKPTTSGQVEQKSGPFKYILVATDGTHTGTHAVEIAAQMAVAFGAKLAVMHVVDAFLGFAPQFAWGPAPYESEYLKHGSGMLDAMIEKLPAGVEATKILRAGDPGVEIVRAARQYNVDLVIVGGPKHHRISRLLLGSVDEALLDDIGCPILVVPPDPVVKEVKQHTKADDYD